MDELSVDVREGPGEKAGLPLVKLLNLQAQDIQEALADHVHKHITHGQVQPAALGMLSEEVAQEVCKALRVDPFALVFKAWAAVRELDEYADPARHPAGEVNIVRWGKCSIRAPQEVAVKLGVLGVELPMILLTLDLRADFQSLALTISDGAIQKITPGPAKAAVSLKCGDATLVRERSTPELQFPHGVNFQPALPVGWRRAAAAASAPMK
jgi:hypothetical protein